MTRAPVTSPVGRGVLAKTGTTYAGTITYFNIPLRCEVRRHGEGVEVLIFTEAARAAAEPEVVYDDGLTPF
jgi:hypothetical protein